MVWVKRLCVPDPCSNQCTIFPLDAPADTSSLYIHYSTTVHCFKSEDPLALLTPWPPIVSSSPLSQPASYSFQTQHGHLQLTTDLKMEDTSLVRMIVTSIYTVIPVTYLQHHNVWCRDHLLTLVLKAPVSLHSLHAIATDP